MSSTTTPAELRSAFDRQRAAFAADPYPALAARLRALASLRAVCAAISGKIGPALRADFGSHDRNIGLLWELSGPLSRIQYAEQNLAAWLEPQDRGSEPDGGARCYVRYQPKGVVGNMAPWNFPVDISLGPLVDILAAGNRALVKPSEHAPHCAELVRGAIAEHFDPSLVHVVTGGVELAEAFTLLPWDHLIYTGNPSVARKVLSAAAANLVPVTLELGGKCPALIAPDRVNDDSLAEVLAVKAVKSGQVCINTDYMFVPRSELERVVSALQRLWREQFPTFVSSPSATGIINAQHYQRLSGYLSEARARGVRVVVLGEERPDASRRVLPMHLVIDPPDDLALMQEEIFGPILPIKPYDSIDQAVAYVNAHERPLALYVFTDDPALADDVLTRTTSGGACVNAIAVHSSLPSLPFGGIGHSGMGRHHGFEGFQTFSHARAVYRRGAVNPWELMRPPWGETLAAVAQAVTGAPPEVDPGAKS
ncbi:MAG TPA: aldehyde dehydrogenase family protein [Polyangiales bacterium]|nr:aldehyde dehydrogenase family protein [Polyangiales bacterium]